ncbi:MAG: glycosyltransferase [Nitrososphaerota archaeon]|nr:glycosyltransferase [Nitrososphaerota archaeon]
MSAYPPDRGRLSEYSHALVAAVSERGVSVRVGSDSAAEADGNIEVVQLWRPDHLPSLVRVLGFVARARARAVVFNVSFTVFGKGRVINFLGFADIFIASKLGRVMGFKTAAIVHNLPEASDTAKFGLGRTLVNRAGFLMAERMLFGCDVVAVTLRLYKRGMERRFGRPVFYLPHGAWKVPNPPLHPKPGKILFLGFLSPGKDMALLRGVYDELKARHQDFGLRMVVSPHPNIPDSDGSLKMFVGRAGVEVRGYATESELPGVFEGCTAVVLPYTTSTGTSGVLHLANSFGVPAVTTSLPEFRELEAEGAGVVVCSGREEMVESIARLVEDREHWKKLSARAAAYSSKLGWDFVARRLLAMIGAA